MTKMLPGKHSLSERKGAKFVGYWMHEPQEQRNKVYRDLRAAYDAALESVATFNEHVAGLRAGGKLTEKGILESASKQGFETVQKLARNKVQATAALRRDIATRIAKMKAVNIDRTDIIGEMQRRELRDHFNSLSEANRHALMRAPSDALLDALLGADPMLIKIEPSVLEVAATQRMEARYGAEKAMLDDLQAALETVDRAYDAARDEIRHELGLQSREFEALAGPMEQPIIEQERSKIERTAVNEQPIADVDKLAAEIVALPFADRERMLDLALNVQGETLSKAA